MTSDPERAAIDHVAQRLSRQFTNLDTTLVARVVWDTYRHFDAHPTRDVVPILVQDAARDRLRVMPAATRTPPPGAATRPLNPETVDPRNSGRIGQPDGDLGDQLADGRPQGDDLGAVRVVGWHTAGNCNANSSSSPSNPHAAPGSPPPTGGDVLVTDPHRGDLHDARARQRPVATLHRVGFGPPGTIEIRSIRRGPRRAATGHGCSWHQHVSGAHRLTVGHRSPTG